MMGIRHGHVWLYSCPGTIRVNLGHCAPLLSYPPVFSSQTPKNPSQIKKKKKSHGCLSSWAPPKLLQTFAYRWCYLSSPHVTTSSGWCLNVTPTWGIGRG